MGAGAIGFAVLVAATWFSWPHLRFWWLFEPLGPNAQGYTEYRHRPTGIVFVSLPGGKFWMGAQKEDPNGRNYDADARPEEGPVHEVTLSVFMIAKHELTQAQWERVMGPNPSHPRGADLPVEWVSWEDCQEFCGKTGLKLPTEAQWEYACRAGASGPYAGTGKIEDMGWYDGNSRGESHPVGEKQPNGFGLHDMQGNMREWCEDLYDSAFYAASEAAGLDPACQSGSKDRVLRGWAFSSPRVRLRCAYRGRNSPFDRDPGIGFRVAASPPP